MKLAGAALILGRVLWRVARMYRGAVRATAYGQGRPDDAWVRFSDGFKEVLGWTDLTAAATLRLRGVGHTTRLDDHADEPSLEAAADANPWFAEHRLVTNPLIDQRVAWVTAAEQAYAAGRAAAIRAAMNGGAALPLHRLNRQQRDQMGEIANVSEQVQLADPYVGGAFPFVSYFSRDDFRVRPTHAAVHGLVAVRNWSEWPVIRPRNGFNCLLPGNRVSGSFCAALRTRYAGPAVEVKTRRGYRFTVTAQHRVLTREGWVAAASLNEGDTLFSHGVGVDPAAAWGVHDDHHVPRVEDVFEAFVSKRVGAPDSVQAALLDLHGDGRFVESDVDVVSADGLLLNAGEAGGTESFVEQYLVGTDGRSHSAGAGGRGTDLLFPRHHAAQPGAVGRRQHALGLFRAFAGDSLPAGTRGGGRAPQGHAGVLQDDRDRGPVAAERLRDGFERFAGGVPRHDGGGVPLTADGKPVSRVPRFVGFGPAAEWDFVATEESKNGGLTPPEFFSQLHSGSAGQITADEVVSVLRFPYRGHVYDLQSKTGCILTSGTVLANCRCYLRFWTLRESIDHGFAHLDGRAKFRVRWPTTAAQRNYSRELFPDPGWRGPKYWAAADDSLPDLRVA